MKRKQLLAILLSCTMLVPAYSTTVMAEENGNEIAVVETAGDTAEEDDAQAAYDRICQTLAITIDTEGKTSAELLAEGQKYEEGTEVTQFYAKAYAYYQAALTAARDAEDEDAQAAAQAAIEALEAFKADKMSEENSPNAQGWIFNFYREGVTASQQGNAELTYNRYYDDQFFFEDPENRGIGGLGDLLRDGTGVEKNVSAAVDVYLYCAEVLGKGNGYTSLGLMYEAETGTYDGITQSYETAMKYFLLSFDKTAVSSTDFKGPRYAALLYDSGYTLDDGTEVEKCYDKARECFEVAVAGNGRTFDGTAAVYLGQYYAEGRTCTHTDADGNTVTHTIEPDMEKAVSYYEKALSDKNTHSTMLGIPRAYLVLGQCYETGNGVEADFGTAIEYYQKAKQAAQDNLDLVSKGSSDEEMEEIKATAEEALERLQADSSAYAGSYAYGDLSITIGDDSTCTVTCGENSYSGYVQFSTTTNAWLKKTFVTVTLNPSLVNNLKNAGLMASYWDGTGAIANGSISLTDGKFVPTLNVNANEVEFSAETIADADSPTGYITTITVEDEDYGNVYVYGEWMNCTMELTDPSDPSSYDTTLYSPYEWKNGNYYNGSSAIAMTLSEETGLWTVSIPLASGSFKLAAVHDLFSEEDAASISQDQTISVAYDAEKQSESFDWTICSYDESIAGTTDISVSFEGANKGGTIQLAVYLPKDYDSSRQYPVVYYIPGGMTTYAKVFDGNKTNSILDHLIADGTLEDTVLIGIERTDNPYLITDIIPYVEANYSVYTDAAHRALYAVSMGSAAATGIWLNEETSDLFDYYGFFSGADKATFDTTDYAELDADYIAELGSAHIMIGGGTQDFNMFTGDSNSASITQLAAWMDNYGIQYSEYTVGGAHNGTTWQPLEKIFFSSLWKHTYTETVEEPTCTEEGYTLHTCVCGDSYISDYTDPVGHSWDQGKVTKEPTFFAPGEKTYTCSECGETRTEKIPAIRKITLVSWDRFVPAKWQNKIVSVIRNIFGFRR